MLYIYKWEDGKTFAKRCSRSALLDHGNNSLGEKVGRYCFKKKKKKTMNIHRCIDEFAGKQL